LSTSIAKRIFVICDGAERLCGRHVGSVGGDRTDRARWRELEWI